MGLQKTRPNEGAEAGKMFQRASKYKSQTVARASHRSLLGCLYE